MSKRHPHRNSTAPQPAAVAATVHDTDPAAAPVIHPVTGSITAHDTTPDTAQDTVHDSGDSAPQDCRPGRVPSGNATPLRPAWKQHCDNRPESFQRFPVECFPSPIQAFVSAQAKDLDCDEASVALPVLSALASSIGSSRRIRLKRSWTEPAMLWTALVAGEGIRRQSPCEAAIGPLKSREWTESQGQDSKWATFEQQWTQYRLQMRVYDGSGPLPERPERPVTPCYVSDDGNANSLIQRLARQPRGLLVCGAEVDELLERALSNRRSRGDQSRWLDLYDGRSLVVESRSASGRPMLIPQASACLTGMIAADVLSQAWTKPAGAGGILDRLLVASPPSRQRRWTDDEADESVTSAYADVLNRLISISVADSPDPTQKSTQESSSGQAVSNTSNSGPGMVDLAGEAKRLFAEFMNEPVQRELAVDHPLAGMAGHLQSSAARLALVLHLAR